MTDTHRILVCMLVQEVSSFNPVPSHARDFAEYDGDELFESQRTGAREVGGALEVFESAPRVTAIAGWGGRAYSSDGVLSAEGFGELSGRFLDAVRANTNVDGVYLCLHGSMVADGEMDPEGYLLEQTRAILGDDIPIVVSLDLHGVLTDKMLRLADACVVYLTYPHVDMRETGARAARLLLRILDEGVRPVTARVAIPALVRGDENITEHGVLGRFTHHAEEIEATEGGLSAGMYISNPFTDVPELFTSAVVTTDGDPDRAAREALAQAEGLWEVHERMQQPLVSLEEAAKIAIGTTDGTVILTDAADATSSGATGDSNAVLVALREAGYRGTVLAPIVDAPAVEAAFAAGVGETVRTTLGGRLDPARFTPMPFEGRVHMLSEGLFESESDGNVWFGGRTAVLKSENETIVVTSRAVMLYDRSLFYAHGQDPRRFDSVVVKSPHCQPHMFTDWAARVVNIDAPGATSANLRSLGHTICPRPMFPLDDDVTFTPRVQLFSRPRYGVLPAVETEWPIASAVAAESGAER
jgi:microcystin degradation protein MlrC